eukprot:5308602-Heterocapsa_arctica.AAC.1
MSHAGSGLPPRVVCHRPPQRCLHRAPQVQVKRAELRLVDDIAVHPHEVRELGHAGALTRERQLERWAPDLGQRQPELASLGDDA